MLNIKKSIASMMALTVLSGGISVSAVYTEGEVNVIVNQTGQDIVAATGVIPAEKYASFKGVVTDVNTVETDLFKATYVSVEKDGMPATIQILEDTYIVDNAEIAVGSEITGYYNANAPMLMIYPPQYKAEVVVVEGENVNVKFDRFDRNLVSHDGQLKLNISDETVITLQDGSAFDGGLANRKLVVTYDVTTRSIPPQTTPKSIVVLFEKVVPVPEVVLPNLAVEISEPNGTTGQIEQAEPFEKTLAESPIRVNGEIIDAPNPFVSARNQVMVPLRAIAEALGYEIGWDSESQSITVGQFITLKIGVDSYNFARVAPIELKAAPELVNDNTYVPLSFFKMVVKAETVAYFEGEIVIDMETSYE